MMAAFVTLFVLALYQSEINGAALTEQDIVTCPINNIDNVPVQPDFDVDRFSGIWYVHSTTTFIYGDMTRESTFREISRKKDGTFSINFAGYDSVKEQCVLGKAPNTKEYGVPGRYKYKKQNFYIAFTYTDYKYAISYLCFDINTDDECENNEIQVEIWSKTQDVIAETVMQELKARAAENVCVQTSDFKDIELGLCEPTELLGPCASSPCQHNGRCTEEDDSYVCLCPVEYSGINCEIGCPITAINHSMVQPDFDMHRFAGLWYVHSSTTSLLGNLTRQSMFRDLQLDKNGGVTLRFGGYDLESGHCIQGYQSGLQQEGEPGYLKYQLQSEAVYTYTDYQYAIGYLLYCADLTSNQECVDLRTQVEIWSKSTDPIPSDVMRNLKSKAEQTLCVQTSDFTDQQLGLCDSLHTQSNNEQTNTEADNGQDSSHTPSEIQNLHVEVVSSTAVNVSWDPPNGGAADVTKYQVVFYVAGEKAASFVYTTKTTYLLTGLRKFTAYGFIVIPYNAYGRGRVRGERLVRTKSDIPSGAPQNVVIQVINSTSFKIRWEPPVYGERHGIITGYVIIVRKPEGCIDQFIAPGSQRSYTVTNLVANQSYAAFVVATGGYGNGPGSNFQRFTLSNENVVNHSTDLVPQPVQNLKVIELTSTSVTLSWQPPPTTSTPIIEYRVIYKIQGGSVTSFIDTANTEISLTSLKKFTGYEIKVKAVNDIGLGEATTYNVQTKSDVPGQPPKNFVSKALSTTSLLFTWDPVQAEEQNGVILSYRLVIAKGSCGGNYITDLNPNTRSYVATNLEPGTLYRSLIMASTAQGRGPTSVWTEVTTLVEGSTCPIDIVPVQNNFQENQFLGVWYTVYQTSYLWGDSDWSSSTFKFVLDDSGNVNMIFTGYTGTTCTPVSTFKTTSPGPAVYNWLHLGSNKAFIKVLYMDDNYAITYLCFDKHENGTCKQNKHQIEIWSHDKNTTLPSEKREEFELWIQNRLCVPSSDLRYVNHGRCEIPGILIDVLNDEGSDTGITKLDPSTCLLDEFPVQQDFVLSQMAGLWYEIARTRFTFNDMESVIYYFKPETESLISSQYSGTMNGICHTALSSMTKHRGPEYTPAEMLAKIGDLDSMFPWNHMKVMYIDDDYLMYYACYKRLDDGSCAHNKKEITLVGRTRNIERETRQNITSLLSGYCMKPSDLRDTKFEDDRVDNLVQRVMDELLITEFKSVTAHSSKFKIIHEILIQNLRIELTAATCCLFGSNCTSFIHREDTNGNTDSGNQCSVPLVKSLHGQEEFDVNKFLGDWKVMAYLDHSSTDSNQHIYKMATFTHRQENSMVMKLKPAEGPVTTAILEPQCRSSTSADFLTSYTSPSLVQWAYVKILYTDYQDAVLYICNREQEGGTCNSEDMLVFVLSKSGNQETTDKVNEIILSLCLSIENFIQVTDHNTIAHDQPSDNFTVSNCAIENFPLQQNMNFSRINGYWYEIAHTYNPMFMWHSIVVYYQTEQFKLGYSGARPEDNVCVGPALGLTKPRCTPPSADFLGELKGGQTSHAAPWKVLYTDYDTALIPYSCMKVLADGSCAPYSSRLHILTRDKTITPELRNKLNNIVAQTCIDPASLLEVTHSVDCKPVIDRVFNIGGK